MAVYVADPTVEEQILAERRRTGADRFDEVWEGLYVMAPLGNNEHQALAFELCHILRLALGKGLKDRIFPGCNVSDRDAEWESNYRCPDVAVFLPDNPAENRLTHWHGGPDFAIEILSPGDRSRDKFGFYASVGVREVLLIDRNPWQLELHRLRSGKLRSAGKTSSAVRTVESRVLPLSFGLTKSAGQVHIEVVHEDGQQRWLA
jgi:Uma2 family endonuclease